MLDDLKLTLQCFALSQDGVELFMCPITINHINYNFTFFFISGFIAFNPNSILKINQTTKMVFNTREIIAYHFVERGYHPRDIVKNTMFDFVAQEYCPDVYNHFLRDLADEEYEE